MKTKVFLIGLVLSLFFWLAVNISEGKLENFLVWQQIARNQKAFVAQTVPEIAKKTESFEPVKIADKKDLEINAKGVISVWIDDSGKEFILLEKDSKKPLPIASLTKIISAQVVLENYDLLQGVAFSKRAVEVNDNVGGFKIGETFTAGDLLYSLLMESSNDTAYALAEIVGIDGFVGLMNLETKNILGSSSNTFFVNPTGLDPRKPNEKIDYSTAEDLAKITDYLLKNQPSIWEITQKPDFNLYTLDEVFHHKILNTDELLGKIPEIIGGKTGDTKQAGGCLILILESPNKRGFLINVILGSDDRFGNMEKLISWVKTAYKW